MVSSEELKRYFWYFFGVLGVVFFWAGVWDGLGNVAFLQNPLFSLMVGIAMLLIGGLVRKADKVKKQELVARGVLHQVHHHPQKHEFHIKYHDKIKKKDILYRADKLDRIEKGFLVFAEKGKEEIFVPIHRVTEVLHKGKTFHKL